MFFYTFESEKSVLPEASAGFFLAPVSSMGSTDGFNFSFAALLTSGQHLHSLMNISGFFIAAFTSKAYAIWNSQYDKKYVLANIIAAKKAIFAPSSRSPVMKYSPQ